jgi:hypothetical protein
MEEPLIVPKPLNDIHFSKVGRLQLKILKLPVSRHQFGLINMEKVHEVIHNGRLCTTNNECNILGLLYITCWHILTEDLNMRQAAAKCVPHLSSDNFLCVKAFKIRPQSNFLSIAMTGDEDENQVKGWWFEDIVEIQTVSQMLLDLVYKKKGSYFEGDNTDW